MLALGLVETRGLIGAIEAADAMLKAADVRLLEKSLASGGLVTITIAGEVAAVQSSVDAAAASIARIEGAECVSRHVIPRPDAELEHILLLQPRSIEIEAAAPAEAAQEGQTSMTDPADKAKPATQAAPPSKEKLSGMSINKLRQLARDLQVPLTSGQIVSSDKKTLIDAICRAALKEKE
ncbi:BMC domain-containing protein [Desulfovibrio sp. QI0430]